MQKHFTDTIFYQIELTAKYCKLFGQQVFEQYNAGIPLDEFAVLDVLTYYPEMCQRDVAKLILKDRANTGKILDILEKKGFVTRKLSIKSNRPVKIVKITDEGKAKVEEVSNKIRPNMTAMKEKIENSDLAKIGDLLKNLREVLNETLDIKI